MECSGLISRRVVWTGGGVVALLLASVILALVLQGRNGVPLVPQEPAVDRSRLSVPSHTSHVLHRLMLQMVGSAPHNHSLLEESDGNVPTEAPKASDAQEEVPPAPFRTSSNNSPSPLRHVDADLEGAVSESPISSHQPTIKEFLSPLPAPLSAPHAKEPVGMPPSNPSLFPSPPPLLTLPPSFVEAPAPDSGILVHDPPTKELVGQSPSSQSPLLPSPPPIVTPAPLFNRTPLPESVPPFNDSHAMPPISSLPAPSVVPLRSIVSPPPEPQSTPSLSFSSPPVGTPPPPSTVITPPPSILTSPPPSTVTPPPSSTMNPPPPSTVTAPLPSTVTAPPPSTATPPPPFLVTPPPPSLVLTPPPFIVTPPLPSLEITPPPFIVTPPPPSLKITPPPFIVTSPPPSLEITPPPFIVTPPPPTIMIVPPPSIVNPPPPSVLTAPPPSNATSPPPVIVAAPSPSTGIVPPPSVVTAPPPSTSTVPPPSIVIAPPPSVVTAPQPSIVTAPPPTVMTVPPPSIVIAPPDSGTPFHDPPAKRPAAPSESLPFPPTLSPPSTITTPPQPSDLVPPPNGQVKSTAPSPARSDPANEASPIIQPPSLMQHVHHGVQSPSKGISHSPAISPHPSTKEKRNAGSTSPPEVSPYASPKSQPANPPKLLSRGLPAPPISQVKVYAPELGPSSPPSGNRIAPTISYHAWPPLPSSHEVSPSPAPSLKSRGLPPFFFHALPPPPPNKDCTPLVCPEPYTNTVPGSPCGCVLPIQVGLRLGISVLTFFPLVSQFASEIAAGILMKVSQVRIMGANADTDQQDQTIVLVDLVPLGLRFDNGTAFFTSERFWHKQVGIDTTNFGDYEVLFVKYPGLPPSPPSSPDHSLNNGPFLPGSGVAYKPLGVDVNTHKNNIGGLLAAVIALSSAVAAVLCIGSAYLLIRKCIHQSQKNETPNATTSGIAAKPSGMGSSLSGERLSSDSFSLSSSLPTYTGSAKTFTLTEIEKATNNFDDEKVLGEGGFGRVYSGLLEDGTKIAVKVLKRDDQQGGREFLAEVEMLSRLHHRNLVKLLGICTEEHNRSLVYELIPNGSVDSHLHGADKESAPLDWSARVKVALGAARGLAYLHEDSSPPVIHRDFKSSNILLEDDFTPKVSDFGLARAALGEGNEHISTRVMGTFGYVAPEYAMTGHLLVKSDVYSYGVVLLELLTGRKPVDMSQPQGQENLVTWARPLLTSKEGLEKIIDPDLQENCPPDSVAKVAAIASMCVQPEVSHRPFMGEVVQALKLVCNDNDNDEKNDLSGSCSQDQMFMHSVEPQTSPSRTSRLSRASSFIMLDIEARTGTEWPISKSEILAVSGDSQGEAKSYRRPSSSGPIHTKTKPAFLE